MELRLSCYLILLKRQLQFRDLIHWYTCIWNMFLKFRSYYSNEYGWMDGWLQGLTSAHSHTCITTKSISHDYDFHNLFAWQNNHKAQYMELKISIVYVTDGNSTIHVYAEHNIKPGTYFNKEFHSQYKSVKFNLALRIIPNVIKWLIQNFASDTTSVLLWYVQNFWNNLITRNWITAKCFIRVHVIWIS